MAGRGSDGPFRQAFLRTAIDDCWLLWGSVSGVLGACAHACGGGCHARSMRNPYDDAAVAPVGDLVRPRRSYPGYPPNLPAVNRRHDPLSNPSLRLAKSLHRPCRASHHELGPVRTPPREPPATVRTVTEHPKEVGGAFVEREGGREREREGERGGGGTMLRV